MQGKLVILGLTLLFAFQVKLFIFSLFPLLLPSPFFSLCIIFDASLSVYSHDNTKIMIPQFTKESEDLFGLSDPAGPILSSVFQLNFSNIFFFPLSLFPHLPFLKSFF